MSNGIIGTPRSYFDKFKFRIEIDGVAYAGFSKCSELSVEVAKIEHWEGGSLIPDKSPGRATFADITLEQGATTDMDLYRWFEQVLDVSAGLGGRGVTGTLYKRNLEIILLDRADQIKQRWKVSQAWPTKFQAGEWDNNSDEKVITSVTLAYDKFVPTIRQAA